MEKKYNLLELNISEAEEISAGGGIGIVVGWILGALHCAADNIAELDRNAGPYGQHLLF